ncbi:hypothetical protein QSJ18_01840 [Gordonia sp. ABSL1-1]|uniref:hypothetical protein n=1 Tax=Gordonia sp. ABSL1-1 TaxID=3053923 RepID=UPI0025743172|nr:hypothetical protein [Gordonia sp. ABSL1-1]MDL9935478.1 hypothetical protein [Gordonia sp. ABSL1-1]
MWDFIFGLESGAWAAIAAWVAVAVGAVTIVVTGRYAKEQIGQAREQLRDAERDRLEQAEKDARDLAEREHARLEQSRQAEQARNQQAEDAQKLRELQARPNVVMFQEPMEGDWQFLEIVVKNFGRTPAFDVRIRLDSLPEVSPDYEGAATSRVSIPETIPILAPGQEWRALWDHAPNHIDAEGIENRHEGTITYTDVGRSQHYETPVLLDFNLLLGTTRVERKTIHDVAKTLDAQLKKTNELAKKVQITLESYSVDEHRGIWVYPADADDERRHRAQQAQERAERSERNRERLDRMMHRGTGEQ